MNIAVVTTLNKKLYKQYGHKFFETYNWPFDLHVYSEDMLDIPNTSLVVRSIFDEEPLAEEFVNRHKDDKPESFLYDGVRFSYKVFSYADFVRNTEDYDGVICIDADSIFYKPIDAEWVKEHLHRDDCMMTYLGRGTQYSECGFLYFNKKHKDTIDYVEYMRELYIEDTIYKLKEQHDSFIWDYARKEFEEVRGTKNHNIGDNKGGHVQARSVLGTVYDHVKGPSRKKTLRSPEARV